MSSPTDLSSPSKAPPAPGQPSRERKLGRRAGIAAYFLLVGYLGGVPAFQVVREAFFPTPPTQPPPFTDCRSGLRALYDAIELGREAAREEHERGSDDADEETALARYRAAVSPLWRYRDAVANMCRLSPEHEGALDAIERLRYAEEHGVRSQAAELSSLRRLVRRIVQQKL